MSKPTEKPSLERLPKLERVFRDCVIRALPPRERKDGEPEDTFKRFELTVSSEFPVQRWFGKEILSHAADAVDLSRFNDSAAVLLEHDRGQQVGVIEPGSAKIAGRKLSLEIRFSRANPRAVQEAQDIEDGIRRNVSVSYIPLRAKLVSSSDDEGDTWEINRWQPIEVSVVSVPADPSVGFDRAAGGPTYPVELDTSIRSTQMSQTGNQPAPGTQTTDQAVRIAITGDANSRALAIVTMAQRAGMTDKLEGWINSDKSADAIAREILDAQLRGAAAPQQRAPEVMTDKDRKRYSYARAIRGAVMAREGSGTFDGLEREVDTEIRKHLPVSYRGNNGILVPFDTRTSEEQEAAALRHLMAPRTRATLTTINPGAAPELVHDRPGELIELLRNRARVIQMGATVLSGLTGPVPFPKQKGGATVQWVQENPPAGVAESNPTFGTVTLNPKTVMGTTPFSRQLLVQASINVEALVRNELMIAHGLGVDRAALHGSGVGNEPLGIYKTPDVNTQAMGGAPSYANFINMLGKIADDNADVDSMGLITTALLAASMMKTLEFATAGAKAMWTGTIQNGIVAGYRATSTQQIAKTMSTLEPTGGTEHGMVFGNWADLLMGFWGAMELVVDPYTLADRGLIKVTSFQMADIAARHGESFCVSTGATPAA